MILITGAMGRIGTAAVRALVARGHSVRALVPAQRRVPWLAELPIHCVEGEASAAGYLPGLLAEVRAAILIARQSPLQVAGLEALIDACRAASVDRLVLLSVAEAAPEAPALLARRQWQTEQHLARSGMPHVVVRSVRLMQEVQHQVPLMRSQQMLVGCQGDGAVPDVDADDVGRVLAGLIEAGELPSTPVLVTGAAAHTRPEMVERLARAWGTPLRYVPCTPLELTQTLLAAGLPRWHVQALVHFEEQARDGRFASVTDAVPHWTGRAARSFADFAGELARAVQYASPPALAPSTDQMVVTRSTRSR